MIAVRVLLGLWILLCTAAACNPRQLELTERTLRDAEQVITAATPAVTAAGGPGAGAIAGSTALALGAAAGVVAAIRSRKKKQKQQQVKTSPSRKR